jgi:hypothetical protein
MRRLSGFILLVVIGMLAILLTVCVGFLSYTRSEVQGVSFIRDKCDGNNVFISAKEWMIEQISNDLFAAGTYKPDAIVSNATDAGPGYCWWYRPYEFDLKARLATWPPNVGGGYVEYPYGYRLNPTWNNVVVPACVDTTGKNEAKWVYMPSDFFPTNTVRARFMVQVFDPNALINLNDGIEDGVPTQAQMAHMIMDGYGLQNLERYRAERDVPLDVTKHTWDREFGYSDVSNVALRGKNPPYRPNKAPIRYHEAWRLATRTVRYDMMSLGGVANGPTSQRWIAPNWVTTNQMWTSGYGAETHCLRSIITSDGIPLTYAVPLIPLGPNKYYPPNKLLGGVNSTAIQDFDGTVIPAISRTFPAGGGFYNDRYSQWNNWSVGMLPLGMPFSMRAYCDPDTGRCPVNVNTCYNSGERMPTTPFGGTPTYTMEGVFNVESLRRIIKIGAFYVEVTAADEPLPANFAYDIADTQKRIRVHATNPSDLNYVGLLTGTLRLRALHRMEEIRTKLAYQYQETLCRYFTGTYRVNSCLRAGFNNTTLTRTDPNAAARLVCDRKYPPFRFAPTTATNGYIPERTFVETYGSTVGAGVKGVLNTLNAFSSLPLKLQFACTSFNYSKTRFPYSLEQFRENVANDLWWMCYDNRNINGNPSRTNVLTYLPYYNTPLGDAVNGTADNDGIETVNFDKAQIPEILPGKLDWRTANAVFDNIIPGKLWNGTRYLLFGGTYVPNDLKAQDPLNKREKASVRDPLWELWCMRLGRDELRPRNNELTASPVTYKQVGVPVAGQDYAGGEVIQKWNFNTHGFHDDNDVLRDSGYPSFDPGSDTADQANIKQVSSRWLHLRPKGTDIGANVYANSVGECGDTTGSAPVKNAAVPFPDNVGPYDQIANVSGAPGVPYRQLCFTPDSFSTELTTTTTNFMFIINAQIVTSESADPALGGNWDNPREIFYGQWGCQVELAPDVFVETKTGYDGKLWPTGKPDGTLVDPATVGLGFYKGSYPTPDPAKDPATTLTWPAFLKTVRAKPFADADDPFAADPVLALWSVDAHCSTLKTAGYQKTARRLAVDTKESASPANKWNDTYDSNYQRWSAAKNWTDFRGVKNKNDTSDQAPSKYYIPGPQTTKRVVIRSLWSHNQGINR